ncbi:prolipoprotein diacylglyceryl transferase family protein, partial [Sphaerochaeta sp.]|uniref:prolipoprotein diacylglyceryl transferase family protein n=1 Tax=Sphaerochaeta sp. TaxID=1972642 RepID=UPI003D12144A
LFLFLWFVIRKRREKLPQGFGFAWYVVGYGAVRFFIEYFRSPDENLGYIIALGNKSDNIALFQSFFNFSMGQLFCLAMIVAGLLFMIFLSHHKGVKHASHR